MFKSNIMVWTKFLYCMQNTLTVSSWLPWLPQLIKQQQQLRPTQNHYTVLKFFCVIVMSKCTIGSKLNDLEFHKLTHSKGNVAST